MTRFKNKITSIDDVNLPQDSSQGLFFLSIPILASKVKQIMPLDSLSKGEVEYTTFIGTKNDDILVKLRSKSDSLGFLIFSAKGSLRDVEVLKKV